jgi:hypothetical protein
MIRVTHARYFITVPGLEQQSSRAVAIEFPRYSSKVGAIHRVPGLERDDIPSGNPWVCSGSTTTYVGESDNAGSHSCSSTTVSCYTCSSR